MGSPDRKITPQVNGPNIEEQRPGSGRTEIHTPSSSLILKKTKRAFSGAQKKGEDGQDSDRVGEDSVNSRFGK